MKKCFTLIAILISFSVSAQQANKLLQAQSKPYTQGTANSYLWVDTTDFKIWAANIDSLKLKIWNMFWVMDSIKNVGDARYAQLLGAYSNPAFVNSLSAAKVFGLSSVATTGDYNDLTNKPNLSLYYLASNPNGYISGVTNGMVLAALGFSPQPQLSGLGFVKINGTTISYDNSTYLTSYTETDPLFDTKFAAKNTGGLAEGSNLYYTAARFNSAFSSKTTTDLTEGSNLYWTNARGDARYPLLSGGYVNPSWITSLPWSKITATPTTLSGYGITDTTSNARAAISLTTTGSGAATYNNSTGVLNVPTFSQYIPTINSATRTINSSTYTISSLQSTVYYTIQISCTASIGSNASGTVLLQYSTNAGSSWNDAGTVSNSNTVTLAIALNSVTTQTCVLSAPIPANALCRLVPTTAGTTTITWIKGSEVY